IVIDMQRDFCSPGGYVDAMGYDITRAQEIVPTIVDLAGRVRGWGGTVILTREGHRADLADLPPFKLWRSRNGGAAIGERGPMGRLLVRGEAGWDFVPELAPQPGDLVVDKPGYSAFHATDLEQILRSRGISKLMVAGVTTDVCVHSTVRDATDRGYECLVVGDACAATDAANHDAALATIATEGGVFGAVASAAAIELSGGA
ncbi:MAG: isochorismatase family cysteine hydrolase, partial [Pseudomonadota bacterium]